MNAVDLLILDTMTSPRSILFGGLSASTAPDRLSEKIGLPPTSIRTRFNGWRADGFLGRWHAIPHPAVFGLRHFVAHIRVGDAKRRATILDCLETVDGVMAGIPHVGGAVGVGIYAVDEAEAKKIAANVAELKGVDSVSEPGEVDLAPLAKEWTPDDFLCLAKLRTAAEPVPRDLARLLGINEAEAEVRLEELLDTGGLYTVPELDFSRVQGALMRVFFDVRGHSAATAYKELATRFDSFFFREVGEADAGRGHAMIALRSVALLDEVEKQVLSIDGVHGVQFMTPVRFFVCSRWMDTLCTTRP